MSETLTGTEVAFDRDLHAYRDQDGARRMSVTQSLVVSGLVDFSRVSSEIMAAAQYRGKLVHHATAIIDKGEDLDEYEVPEVFQGYVEGYHAFLREMKFVANQDWIERPMIVNLFGHRIGMTPDAVGLIDGVPTLIERKTSSSQHPAWRIQTAGYDLGLRSAGLQIRQRFAVRLTADGHYKLHPHDDASDFETFGDCYRMAAWKLKHRLASLD